VAAHCGLLARTLDRGGGCPVVCVSCVEVAGLTFYHPHVECHLEQLQISKAFVYSKIQFLFKNNFSLEFYPLVPASPVLARSAPQAAARTRSTHPSLRGLGIIAKSHLYFEFAQPGDDAFSLCHCQEGPTCQIHPLPRAGRPQSEIPRASDGPELLQPSLITLPP
jgi:hypothetical protein